MKQLRSSPSSSHPHRPTLAARLPIVVLGLLAVGLVFGGSPSAAHSTSASVELASPSASLAPDVVILSLSQLQAELSAAQSDGQQRTVISDVALDQSKAADHHSPACLHAEDCPTVVGEIVGIPGVPVWASPDVAQSLGDPQSPPANEPLALTFGNDGVIMLIGAVVPSGGDTVAWPATATGIAAAAQSPLQAVIAVDGWLSWTGPLPCPLPALPTPPPGSPFVTCPGAWITADEYQPVHARTVTPPADGIRVQPEAYNEFVPENAGQVPAPPAEGAWLLQLVEDPRPNRDPQRGWQLVGELDPPTGVAPGQTPIPSSETQP